MATDFESKPALATFVRLHVDPLSGGPVLAYPGGSLDLNPMAHGILSRCDGATTVGEIIAALGNEFDADADDLTAGVLDTLRQLAERDLIVFAA